MLERHRGERLLIVLSGYPDPDNIASGLALQHLASEHGIESRLLTFHEVSHQENQALVTKLELDLWLYDDRCDLDPYTLYALVDSSRADTPIQDAAGQQAVPCLRRPPQEVDEIAGRVRRRTRGGRLDGRHLRRAICARRIPKGSTPTTPSTSSWPPR